MTVQLHRYPDEHVK
ncbi:d9929671-105e-43ef-9d4d-4a8b8304bc81 [Thermothielavioides terrestris]|uniref:D9929671-105e-43ef-9d4d-4a8b8304bc81 n=1 Tax=Thermothielavioides terrestris TaxID=2587410 RepID=A0A3S4B9X5_9PEZI|nr:d9929671-105e-43ef-9d4d-4a8b8304bc81 [Thermothielavioides terrestris]